MYRGLNERYYAALSRLFVILFFVLAFCTELSAQTFNFTQYTTKDGLASSKIYFCFQDKEGYIWIATENGVNRFNGHDFRLFTSDDGLADNEILQIKQDSQGRIWFLSLNGKLSFFYQGKFYNPNNNKLLRSAICNGSFVNFLETKNGDLWFATNQNGLLRIKRDNEVSYIYGEGDYLSNLTLFETEKGSVIGTNNVAAYQFIPETSKFARIRSEKVFLPTSPRSYVSKRDGKVFGVYNPRGAYDWQKKKRIDLSIFPDFVTNKYRQLFFDSHNKLWAIGLSEGLTLIGKKNTGKSSLLPDTWVSGIMEDMDGNIWISTLGQGIYFLPFYYSLTTTVPDYKGSAPLGVSAIVKVGERLIMGMNNGDIDEYVPNAKPLKLYRAPVNAGPVKELRYLPKEKELWYATGHYLCAFKGKKFEHKIYQENKKYYIKMFAISHLRQIAISSSSGLFLKQSLPQHRATKADSTFIPQRAYAAYFSKKGDLWYSNLLGLHLLNQTNSYCLHDSVSELTERITDIAELPDGRVVCATYGKGVLLLKDFRLIKTINTGDSLVSNICKKLFIHKNVIWVATGEGLSAIRINGNNIKITNYSVESGLISDEINDILVEENRVFIATNLGLTICSPDITINKKAPPLYILNATVNKQEVKLRPHITFKYNENNITINYIGLDYSAPRKIKYRYRLRDNQKWTETMGTSLVFPALEPGVYRLAIAAQGEHSTWSSPVYMIFEIKPPLWQTWWFVTIEILTGIVALVSITLYYIKKKQKHERDRLINNSKIISLEQQALQAMMNPHFIFNVMNSIQYFINVKDNTKANQVLTGFARLIRKNLDIVNKSRISIADEMDYLNLYLSLEKMRFGEKLKYEIIIANDIQAQNSYIPTMLLQPYVENAIWHGIMPMAGNGLVEIIVTRENESFLKIQIRDNGVGYDPRVKSQHGHVSRGMELTAHRLELLNKFHGSSFYFSITKAHPKGTIVTLTVPILPFTQ